MTREEILTDEWLRRYSADIALAWEVVDYFESKAVLKKALTLRSTVGFNGGAIRWVASFGSAKAEAETAPRAICLAARLAVAR